MIKRIVVYLSICLLAYGCCDDNEVFGVYHARFKEKGTIHYLELFPDGTFCHVYEKNNIKKEHKGFFQLYKYEKQYHISFDDWKDFDVRTIEYKKRYHSWRRTDNILINKGQIFFDLDLYELNFKKE